MERTRAAREFIMFCCSLIITTISILTFTKCWEIHKSNQETIDSNWRIIRELSEEKDLIKIMRDKNAGTSPNTP